MTAAVIGGTAAVAHSAGKKSAQKSQQEADQNAAIEALQDQQAAPQAPAPAAAGPAPAAPSSDDKFAELTKLKDLLDQGILTQAEFDLEKQKILQSM
jgi:hypothetical protein